MQRGWQIYTLFLNLSLPDIIELIAVNASSLARWKEERKEFVIYIYIYIHIERDRERGQERERGREKRRGRKGERERE